MMFCNPGPIAASCYLSKDVVQSTHQAFIQAVCDLTRLGYNLSIGLGFIKFTVNNKDLKYSYSREFVNTLNNNNFEYKMRKSDMATSDYWQTSYQSKWAESSLNTLLKRPNNMQVQ